LEEISKGPHLKDDPAFALLTAIFPHMVTMFNNISKSSWVGHNFEWGTHWVKK
jgi:hypothetical protein